MSSNVDLLSQLQNEFPFEGIAEDEARWPETADQVWQNAVSHEYIAMAQTIFLSGKTAAPRDVVLCGVDRESGSREICIGLGRALAACSRRRVCLIDADQHNASLERLLTGRGMDLLHDEDENLCRSVERNLWLAGLDPHGWSNGRELPPPQQVRERIAILRKRFDFILMNAPGANAGGEASVLGQASDGAILVIEANVTRKAAAINARDSLLRANVRILGSVLSNRTFPIPERLYQML